MTLAERAARISGAGPAVGGERGRSGLTLVFGLAAVALVAAVVVRQADPNGFSIGGALAGIASQLPVTLPAAILLGVASLANGLAGAVLVRLVRGVPFRTWSDLVLIGFGAAVLLDCSLVFSLGGLGLFRQGSVGAILAVVLALGLVRRPLVAIPLRLPRPAGTSRALMAGLVRWLLIGLVWGGPLVVALASPVVPAGDVLPNHVAPAEHLRVFGQIATLATYPSPIYGPSRLFLGYSALMATLATLTALPAALSVAAFTGPLIVLTAVGVRRLAAAFFGAEAGFWVLLAYPLASTFVRLPDVRDSVVALPLAALALAQLAGPPGNRPAWTSHRLASRFGPDWILAVALAATILVHPLVGALTEVTVVIVTLADPARYARRALPAVLASAVAALPQLAVMIGFAPVPAWGLVAFAGAAIAGILAARLIDLAPPSGISTRSATAGLALIGLAVVSLAIVVDPAALGQAIASFNPAFPVLFGGAILAVGLVPAARGGRRVLVAALAAGGAMLLGVALLPDTSLLGQSLRYEIPKAVGYWLPWACVPAVAALVSLVARRPGPLAIRTLAAGVFLAIVLVPFGPIRADRSQASQPVAAVLVHQLETAQTGYWQGYPDDRLVVASSGADVLDFLRTEIAAGRISAETQLLHVAASYQESASLPIGDFTGIEETLLSADSTTTIFTVGGRIHPLSSLAVQLAAGFPYVVLEPAGLPASIRAQIDAAGYRLVFRNGTADVLVGPA